jgi:tRNA(adenine34) deaminase
MMARRNAVKAGQLEAKFVSRRTLETFAGARVGGGCERADRWRVIFSTARMVENLNDVEMMRAALVAAREAGESGEVPVGAVVMMEGRIVSRSGNRTIADCDPTGHAEIIALREAAREIGNYRLLGATLYVTIEPCAMCAGAMIQARIARLVYGADDAKGGAVRSCFSILEHERLNHRVEVTSGVLAEESAGLLKAFFAARR